MYLFLIQEIEGNYGFMDAEEAAHCIKVLRKGVGDTVFCIDGKGGYYEGRIEKIAKTGVTVLLLNRTENYGEKQKGKVILAASPLRQKERFEWLIEKATELGTKAEELTADMQTQANVLIDQAKLKVAELTPEAEARLKELEEKGKEVIDEATIKMAELSVQATEAVKDIQNKLSGLFGSSEEKKG